MNNINHILIVFGTRPEAIKMAPVFLALRASGISVEICVTAQHRQMLDSVMDFFKIRAEYDLNLMQANQSLNQLASRIFFQIDEVLIRSKPDIILVHGDTTTSCVAAWAAFHRGIKVAHVEAGLRTYNKYAPFPEELNRQITGKIADLHFAPTEWAAANLYKEGIKKEQVIVTGNTVIDALYLGKKKIEDGYSNRQIRELNEIINPAKKLILVTGHRRESFGRGFENICKALKEIVNNEDVQIIYPVHLNPNVQEPVNRILGGHDRIHLIEPLDYPAFIYAMSNAYFIITDSGGVQEEAPSLGKPVLLMRDNTERPEAVEAGSVKLVGTSYESILLNTNILLNDMVVYNKMKTAQNPYGDGKASDRILKALS
jgi:UDP-N-acetylglucosamine 2-epimerase (non-hydrolysing)